MIMVIFFFFSFSFFPAVPPMKSKQRDTHDSNHNIKRVKQEGNSSNNKIDWYFEEIELARKLYEIYGQD